MGTSPCECPALVLVPIGILMLGLYNSYHVVNVYYWLIFFYIILPIAGRLLTDRFTLIVIVV